MNASPRLSSPDGLAELVGAAARDGAEPDHRRAARGAGAAPGRAEQTQRPPDGTRQPRSVVATSVGFVSHNEHVKSLCCALSTYQSLCSTRIRHQLLFVATGNVVSTAITCTLHSKAIQRKAFLLYKVHPKELDHPTCTLLRCLVANSESLFARSRPDVPRCVCSSGDAQR